MTYRRLPSKRLSRDRDARRLPFLPFLSSARPVVVVGGAGYIGTRVVARLLSEGFRVRVLDRLMYGPGALTRFASHPHFTFLEGDAADIGKLTSVLRGAGAVVHLAGLVGDPACALDEPFTRQTNRLVTRLVRDASRTLGIKRFIFASSCSVYGTGEATCEETTPVNPVSLYAATKVESERELLEDPSDDFTVTVLRFATVFGHSQRPRYDLVANLFTAQALIDGHITVIGPQQWRPFVHVADLARAVHRVLIAPPSTVANEIFNVGDDRYNRTILQLAYEVQEVVQTRRPVAVTITAAPGDPRNYAVSFAKIRRTLDFEASISIRDGVQEILEHLLASGERDYRSERFSNVAMTRLALDRFRDPAEFARLYVPLNVS
jgi:nucleoside-diphosphate-sugar epimerase